MGAGHLTAVERLHRRAHFLRGLNRTHMASMYQVVTVSIGIARITERRFATLRVFVNDADGALYDAKAGERNRVVCEPDSAQAHLAVPLIKSTINT